MTAPSSKKTNATGRSTGQRKTNRQTQIGRQFAPRTIDMLRSPAYRALSLTEHRIIARLEIELADHGGADNGALACTFSDFQAYGARRESIGPALRALEALGFIHITEHGRAGNADWRRPNIYRLTFRSTGAAGPTDEWEKIETIDEAEAIAAAARAVPKRNHKAGGRKNKTPPPETVPQVGTETAPRTANLRYRNGSTGQGTETGPLSRSREESGESRAKRAPKARAATGAHWSADEAERYLADVHENLKTGWAASLLKAEARALRQIAEAEHLAEHLRSAAARLSEQIERAA